jgi:hypothetical protein
MVIVVWDGDGDVDVDVLAAGCQNHSVFSRWLSIATAILNCQLEVRIEK